MEELQKLYDVLVRDGYYTNDFETFISKWDDPEYKQKVYEVTSREGLYTQDFESFNNKYQKKNRNLSKEDSISATQKQNGELVSENTSLGTPTPPINQPETLEGEGEIPTISIDKSQSNADPTLGERPEGEGEDSFGEYVLKGLDTGVAIGSKSIYDFPSLIYDAAATITNPISRALGIEEASSEKFAELYDLKNIPSEVLQKKISEKQKEIQEYNDANGGDVLTALEDGNVLGAAKMIAGTTAQSLPLMIPAFF